MLYVQSGGPLNVDTDPLGASLRQLATVLFSPLVSFFSTEFVGRPVQHDAETWVAYTYQFGVSSPFPHVFGCVCEAVTQGGCQRGSARFFLGEDGVCLES